MHDLIHLCLVLGAALGGVFVSVAAVMRIVARNESSREWERIAQALARHDLARQDAVP